MTTSSIKVHTNHHMLMSEIAKKRGMRIIDLYSEVLEDFIKHYTIDEVIDNTKLEKIIEQKIDSIDKHLAAMLGRVMFDNAMGLMGIVGFLTDYYEDHKTLEEITSDLRIKASAYIQEERTKTKESKNK